MKRTRTKTSKTNTAPAEARTSSKRPRPSASRARTTVAPRRGSATTKAAADERQAEDADAAHGRRDVSDVARDERLRSELESGNARSPSDRHRQRLTAIEAEEDDAKDADDDDENDVEMREQALDEQEADDPARD